jgi:hypothetical protein
MSSPGDIQIGLDRGYVMGLIDHLSRPVLSVDQRKYGYYLDPEVVLNTNQSPHLEGALSYFLENHGIRLQTEKNQSSDTHLLLKVGKDSSVAKLANEVDGELIQTADRLSFLADFIEEFRNLSMRDNQEKVLGLFEAWGDINPQWRRDKKFTPGYLENNHPEDINPVGVDMGKPNYRNKLDEGYIAGMFDAVGNLVLSVKESSSTPTGYYIEVRLEISLTYPNIRMKPHLKLFLRDTDISFNIRNHENTLELLVFEPKSVAEFIDLIHEYSLSNFDVLDGFRSFIIPALINDHQSTQEGMIEILEVYDTVKGGKKDRLYTADYFASKWG